MAVSETERDTPPSRLEQLLEVLLARVGEVHEPENTSERRDVQSPRQRLGSVGLLAIQGIVRIASSGG